MVTGHPEKLTADELTAIETQKTTFPLLISSHYAGLINWDDPRDPLRNQVIPSTREFLVHNDESTDPLAEEKYTPIPGLIHKYQHRVLWLVTQNCPIHCRFCFRRCGSLRQNSSETISADTTHQILSYLNENRDIVEVILSGGDPFSLSPEKLNALIEQIKTIQHIRLLRIHSRYPVADPERMHKFNILRSSENLMIRVVLHINHPNELSEETAEYIGQCLSNRIPVLSQTVLLKGINDHVDTLHELFLNLVKAGAQPYYLHHLDYVLGTAHFRVSVQKGKGLIKALRARLPGYSVPTFVRDLPDRASKTIL